MISRVLPSDGSSSDDASHHAVSSDEERIVALQIGRAPRGARAVSAWCSFGLPAVVRTAPVLDDGTPFPTLYYLTCPVAVRALGQLEAAGRMRDLNEALTVDPVLQEAYARAHARYLEARGPAGPDNDDVSAGGMPTRVKCLHALYAHEVSDANPIGAILRDEIEPLACPEPCVTDGARTPGHPGFAGKR